MDNSTTAGVYISHLLQPLRDVLIKYEDHFRIGTFDVYEAGEKFRIQVGMFWVYFKTVEDLNTIIFGLTGKCMEEKEYRVMDEVRVKWDVNTFKKGEKVTIINITPSAVTLYLCQNKDGFIATLTQNDFSTTPL
jgi:hypothetical protein